MLELECAVQSYNWGKLGNNSKVAQLKIHDPNFQPNTKRPYAELWMGTHPNGPSLVCTEQGTRLSLFDWIQQQSHHLGKVKNDNLPFLFKVLSIEKPLSIQIHPDINSAQKLHALHPEIYKDANHKPEMAIALSQFEALCQFRDITQIITFLETVVEFRELVQPQIVQQLLVKKDREALRVFFEAFISVDAHIIEAQLTKIVRRLNSTSVSQHSVVEKLVLRLYLDYPNDIGCFCPFLLNYLHLKPGEAIFLASNEPHAYLSGDCVECMACSDNVVRAALTSKLIDKATLCELLTYSTGMPTIHHGQEIDSNYRLYTTIVPEFQVERYDIPTNSTYDVPVREDASILLILQGNGQLSSDSTGFPIQSGKVFFISANEAVRFDCESIPVQAYRACPRAE
uniref:mannose-6-phosphate isomerase n=1 Tax=Albugo laibachii Nc14 TaxID=890382 RepID=F0W3Y0_9STRA|nr:mannose6phosphate isomerase putative [Albugo laibachii Nc14]|eukprot:CCA15775.1 mannose6phosphate isomerase putative [Albugo laibachii Nc14]